jgi:manganese efflux pump family protein
VSVAALITWLITAGGGLFLLAIWLIEYDRDFQTAAATRLPVPVISGHALLAVAGLGVWSAYLILDDDRLAWAAVAILGVVAALGLTMAARWLKVYRTTASRVPVPAGPAGPPPSPVIVPPERHFPVPVVIAHGALAVTTLVLVLLTALRAGR